MKNLVNLLIGLSVVGIIIAIIIGLISKVTLGPILILGIGPRGFLSVSSVLLFLAIALSVNK